MKKNLTILSLTFLVILLLSCNNTNSNVNNYPSQLTTTDSMVAKNVQSDTLDKIVSTIIAIAANDFFKNQQPAPVAFNDVKLKYIKKSNGEELYILCGRFVTDDKQETPFATVKNSDYEQWIGTSALTYCQDSKEISYTKEDLSSALKNKFISLKN